MTPVTSSALAGLAGAVVLNAVHETVRQLTPDAPRADLLGKQVLKKWGVDATGDELHYATLAADVAANALYYAAIGLAKPRYALPVGAALGLAAGVGAVALPGPLGLSEAPTTRTPATTAMTVGWYLLGGLVAAGTFRLLRSR